MYMIAKFIPELNEWLPLPFIFTNEIAASAHIAKLGGKGYRVYFQGVAK
jgi:hypothetical protein